MSDDTPPDRVERLRELAKALKAIEAENLAPAVILAFMNALIAIMLEFVDDQTGLGQTVPNKTMRMAYMEVAKVAHGRGAMFQKWIRSTKKSTSQQAIILSLNTQVMWLTILMVGMLGRTGIASDLRFTDEEIANFESLLSSGDKK